MSINLFDACLELSVQGIKEIKLMGKEQNGNPINFPIDIVLTGASFFFEGSPTVLGSVNELNKTVTIGNQVLIYVQPQVENANFVEESVEDRRGKYYQQTISISFPKVQLFTNNQLKDFLFTDQGEFAIANAVAIITDNNDVDWIIGYDLPLVVELLELTSGGEDNYYQLSLVSRSYERLRHFKNI